MRKSMDLTEYAAYLLGLRDYSVFIFRDKCCTKFPDELGAIEVLVSKFIEKKYLDDQRFAVNFIRREFLKENPAIAQDIEAKIRAKLGVKAGTAVVSDVLSEEEEA